MNINPHIGSVLARAEPIGLEQMDGVSLQNRIDKKYMLHAGRLPGLIASIIDHYYVLEITGNRIFSYKTVYFDTPDFQFFKDHHNGLTNRIKVRCRQYIESDSTFFEIKRKYQGYRTDKYRKTITALLEDLGNEEYSAIKTHYQKREIERLDITLNNFFYRVTLVSKTLRERVTMDFGLKFSTKAMQVVVDDVAIVEVKQGKYDELSPIIQTMKREKIYPNSISKYIYGLLLTGNGVKYNAFKHILQKVNKIQNINGSH